MAKFTVYFKEKAIQTGVFEAGVVHIGRDPSNDLMVDSLAIAPAHAVALIKDGGCVIKQMNDKFPLLINNRQMKECNLQDNDIINIGKHYIVFSTANSMLSPGEILRTAQEPEFNEKMADSAKAPEANLQVMSGDYIGRIVPLKKAMTRLGHEGSGVVVIARRKDGYFVSALEEHEGLAVNNQLLGGSIVKLHHKDILVVDKTPLQFFLE
jgi:hypothetical protein